MSDQRGISYWNANTSMAAMTKRHKERMAERESAEDDDEPTGNERLTGSELLDRLWGRSPDGESSQTADER